MESQADQFDNGYLQIASNMTELGYGEFERCLKVLKACKGDEEEAKNTLSGIIFKEE